MQREKILFVYFDAGAGHRVVAEAVADAIRENPSNRHDVQLVDFFSESGLAGIESITKDLYNHFLIRHRILYALYYHLGNFSPVIRILYKFFIDQRFWQSIHGIIEKHDPRMCVVVNPHLCECFYRASSGREQRQFWINLVSDPFSVHSLWLSPHADFNLVFSEEARRTFLRRGIASSKIKLFDYPVRMKFAKQAHCREEILATHSFVPDRLTILIYAGWHNARMVMEIARRIGGERLPVQAFLVLGKRDAPEGKRFGPHAGDGSSMRFFGYAENMDELMEASDLVVCKAGPATIFEAVNMRKPMALLSYLPGQEKGNKDFVLAHDFGWYCKTPDEFLNLLRRVLFDRSILEEKAAALRGSRISNGSPRIAQFLTDLLSSSHPSPNGPRGWRE